MQFSPTKGGALRVRYDLFVNEELCRKQRSKT
jgi:hypothetical protein